MNEIEIISQIKRENLDEKKYFKTLMEEAYNNKMITEEDIINIQMQLIQLLEERIYKYIGLDNSSIRKEIMEDINESNYYTIGLQLKTFSNPDEAIKQLKKIGVKDFFYNGRNRINRMLSVIKVMYMKLKKNKLKTRNTTYNDTIIGGIQGFLKIYNPDFKAHDMKITADYPLYNNLIGKLEGVEFIKEYINSIYLENEFCNKFSSDKIEKLLYSYSNEYANLIINIFEIVFLEVIACKLIKKNVYNLELSNFEIDEIYKTLKKETDIEKIIQNSYREICNEIISEEQELQKYIKKNLSNICQIIKNGLEQNTLDKVFITQKLLY